MKRLFQIAVGIGVAVIMASRMHPAVAAPVIKTIFPTTSAPPGAFTIAVLSDHYKSSEQSAFDTDASNLFVSGLFNDPNYTGRAGKFIVRTIFDAWPSTDPSQPPLSGNSNYGFEAIPSGDCDVSSLGASTAKRVHDVAAAVSPWRIVVIGNYLGNDAGCTKDNWTFLYSGSSSGVLPHEIGHLAAGLYDEYLRRTTPYPGPPINDHNCSTSSPPYWTTLGLTGITNQPGCDLYPSGIVRPSNSCLMLSASGLFCSVCDYVMTKALEHGPPLQVPPAPTNLRIIKPPISPELRKTKSFAQPTDESTSVSVLVTVDRRTRRLQALSATNVVGPVYEQSTRLGNYVFEVRDGGRLVSVGTLPGDPFEVRSYRKSGLHDTTTQDVATFSIVVPFVSKAALASHRVEIHIYRMNARAVDDRGAVTLENFSRLHDQKKIDEIGSLKAGDLQKLAR